MSLSRIIERKKELKDATGGIDHKDNKTEGAGIEESIMEKLVSSLLQSDTPKLVRQAAGPYRSSNVVMDDPESNKRNYLFVSDTNMNSAIKEQLHGYGNVLPYTDNFINRSTSDLLGAGIEALWINISNKRAREWLSLNLKPCVCYTRVLVWSSSKSSKFLDDLRPYVDLETRARDLSKLSALSLDELMKKVEDRIDIHSVPNKLMVFLGCSKQTVKKKALAPR
mgnify:CR=1 FL=1